MLKGTWKPRWIVENRTPTFMGSGPPVGFGCAKYLWGKVAAFDVIQLGQNEGVDFQGPIDLLFAGGWLDSGLMRFNRCILTNSFCHSIGRPTKRRPLS